MSRSAASCGLAKGFVVIIAALAALVIGVQGPLAHAVGLNYVEADDLIPNIGPAAAINSAGFVNNDNLWGFRSGFGANSSIFESGITEDSPQIMQTLSGLTPGNSYDLYAVYWTDKDENWTIRTGTTSGSLTLYSFTGVAGGAPGSTKGITAGAAVWDMLPPPTDEGTIFTERPADPLIMLLGKAGTATANGAGQIQVFVDDTANAGGGQRTWFDGVAYVDAGTTIALTASIDRATGALTIANPTSQNFQIKAVTLDSPFGALSTTGWTPISGRLDANGNSSFDTDPWTVTPPATMPFATQLAEAEDPSGGGTGGTLAAGGGSISLGNVWARTHVEDIRLSLTLADDTLAMISPVFTGTSLLRGDFNASGGPIDLADFQTLLANLHTDVSTLTNVERYQRGDITTDGQINFNDFAAFRTAFDAQGIGSFEALLAQVPEPSGLAVVACLGAILAGCARRRSVHGALAATLCLTLAGASQAQTLLKVDVDHRAGDATGAPPGDNTVPGFSSFTLPTDTTGGLGAATNTVDGYTITLTAVDAAGVPTGVFDDRDRATPTTAPTLNQLYDDFIFANVTTTGVGGGLDMAINSGGALMPNTQYAISIYSFDTVSTGNRTANWLDGNSGNLVALSTAFNGSSSPTTDERYKFNGLFRTDGSGNLLLRARETTTTTHGVFLDGFEITVPIELTLEVNTTTGAMRLLNEQAISFDMSYYEIRSAAGSLNLGGWASLDDTEGGDPVGTGWDEAGGVSANILSEVNLTSMTPFGTGSTASLGSGFMTGGAQDLRFFYAAPTESALRTGLVKYVTGGGIVADFNNSGAVDGGDLAVWRSSFPGAGADADNDGDSDGNDFLIWQRRLGATSATGAAAAVPEPSTVALVLLGGALAMAQRRTGRRRG